MPLGSHALMLRSALHGAWHTHVLAKALAMASGSEMTKCHTAGLKLPREAQGCPRWHHRKSGSILHRRNAFLRHPGFPLACQCLLRRDYVGVGETQTSTCPPESGRLTTADLFFCTETSFWLGPVSWLYNQKAQFWNSTRNTRRRYRSVCHPYFSFTYRRISALCTLCRRHRGRCQLFREAPRKEHFQALCRRSSNCSELFNLS